jgi:hypothetical protein
MTKWIEIEHPDVEVTAIVADVALKDHHSRNGWTYVADASGPEQLGRPKKDAKKAASKAASNDEKKG